MRVGLRYAQGGAVASGAGKLWQEVAVGGAQIKVGKFPFVAKGRALANDEPVGFAKIIADTRTDKLLGSQIIGSNASELIAEIVSIMEFGGSAEDLGRTVHAHPTLSEAVKEAGLAVDNLAFSIPPNPRQ